MTKDEALKLALEALECTEHPQDHYEAITAIKEALMSVPDGAQPEQPKVRTGNCLRVGVCASEGHKIAPQRKPLTDEEIILIVAECASSHQHTDIHFARAIEAAHGIIAPTELKGEA